MKKLAFALALLLVASGAEAAVLFQDLGTAAPPTGLGPYATVAAFSQTPQAAIADGTSVAAIPGSATGGTVGVTPNLTKHAIGSGWATWSNGYTGVVYVTGGGSITMTMPTMNTGAFYFYAEPNQFSNFVVQATTNTGATSGPITVNGSAGANGFAFYTTTGEAIATVTVTCTDTTGFAIGEFGASTSTGVEPIPALSPLSLGALGAALALGGAFLLRKRS